MKPPALVTADGQQCAINLSQFIIDQAVKENNLQITSSKSDKWVLFDGDNTLWQTEPLYDIARENFCQYVLGLLSNSNENTHGYLNKDTIDGCQRHRDLQLHKTHGYSFSRFARSFEDTLTFFLPSVSPEHLHHVRSLAMSALDAKAAPFVGVEEVLEYLMSENFSLAIITAGERWVQQKRLNDFSLLHKFKAYVVVDRKDAREIGDFCDRHSVDVKLSWMIGDSVQSDIIPANAIGLNTIHFKTPNWIAEFDASPDNTTSTEK